MSNRLIGAAIIALLLTWVVIGIAGAVAALIPLAATWAVIFVMVLVFMKINDL